jgi:hypothetical protein
VVSKRKLHQLERALTKVYLNIFDDIQKDERYPNDLLFLQQKYGKLVYDNTRSAVQQAVILGIEHVNRKTRTEPYLTLKDIELIEKNTAEQVASFWRKIALEIKAQREAQLRVELMGAGIRDFLNATAISSVFSSVADAVVSKLGQLRDVLIGQDIPKAQVTWVAMRDEKTCRVLPNGNPGCASLDGQVFDYDDPNIPVPGRLGFDGTHPYCRCMIEPLI